MISLRPSRPAALGASRAPLLALFWAHLRGKSTPRHSGQDAGCDGKKSDPPQASHYAGRDGTLVLCRGSHRPV